MKFNRYRIQLLIRLLLLTATIYLFTLTDFDPAYRGTYIGLGIFALLQVGLLIWFHERTIRQLNRFLNSIRSDDFTEQFQAAGEAGIQKELSQRLNEVMVKFRDVRAEKEANLHYFEAIVQHIGIGIITYQPDGTILLLNNAAKKLLQVNQAKSLQELAAQNTDIAATLQQVNPPEKVLVQMRQGGELVNLSIHVIGLMLLGQPVRIASIQNIQHELEDKEMEAWHTLVKVLTHEIMNSVTPIASLSSSAGEEIHQLTDTTAEEITVTREELMEIGRCLTTISRRSDGLIRFLTDFRNLAVNVAPKVSLFNVADLLQEIKILFREQLAASETELLLEIKNEPLMLSADRSMIEQVLINLVKNAMEAVQDQAERVVTLSAYLDERSRVAIEVSDTGNGLTAEAQSKIFVPFYTTKPQGSGIGLSLSRQIMRLHKGSVSVSSELGKGTTFTLRF